METILEPIVDFVRENSGLSGNAARELEQREDKLNEEIERQVSPKRKKEPRN